MIDFHCHLDLYREPRIVVEECISRRVFVLAVTTTPSAFAGTRALVGDAARVRVALGLHPQLAHERQGELALFDQLLPEARYLGEVGLDGSPELKHTWASQIAVFRHVLNAAQNASGRIISIHSRRAAKEVVQELQQCPRTGIAVLHWYSGSLRDLRSAIDIGCWFSVGPAMVRSKSGIELIKVMPKDRVLTETDGPFVTVEDEPAYPWDAEIAEHGLARVWQCSVVEVRQLIRGNLLRLTEMKL